MKKWSLVDLCRLWGSGSPHSNVGIKIWRLQTKEMNKWRNVSLLASMSMKTWSAPLEVHPTKIANSYPKPPTSSFPINSLNYSCACLSFQPTLPASAISLAQSVTRLLTDFNFSWKQIKRVTPCSRTSTTQSTSIRALIPFFFFLITLTDFHYR